MNERTHRRSRRRARTDWFALLVLAPLACSTPNETRRISIHDGSTAGIASGGASGSGGAAGTQTGGASSGGAGGFCDGTAVAGTCLASFFAEVQPCFEPTGSCVMASTTTKSNFCWASGAKLLLQGTRGEAFTYRNGNNVCFYGSWEYTNGAEKDYTFTADGFTLLVYNRSTGETVCTDGSRATLAPNFGGCAEILSLVDIVTPGCKPGSCVL